MQGVRHLARHWYVAAIDIIGRAHTEVGGLHDFFVAWFRGDLPDTDDAFARFADATHPEFSMVVSTGVQLDRHIVLAHLRGAHRSRPETFRIETRNFTPVAVMPESVLTTYEEWQFDGDELLTARTSTAYFVADPHAPEQVAWRHLHETLRHT